jgi:streptogramin lyase
MEYVVRPSAFSKCVRSNRSLRWLNRPRPSGRIGHGALLIVGALATAFANMAFGQSVTEFPVPTASSVPLAITAGPDGNLWFNEQDGNTIGKITTAGVITEYVIPTANSHPIAITPGPDGNLWFTEFDGHKIGRITTAGVITEFPIPLTDSGPVCIAAGLDGNLWFTENPVSRIGRITTAGVITQFDVPTASSGPGGIGAGPDGNLWFTEQDANQIGRITTAGVFTEFPIPTVGSLPKVIEAGPDGNLWFTEFYFNANKIGRITPAGVITEFHIPTSASEPVYIAPGPDGNMWFAEANGGKIGQITAAGAITEFPLPTYRPLNGIVAGSDGNLWFTEPLSNNIGRIIPPPVTPQPMAVDARSVTGSSSNHNGVLEPGETVQVAPSWKNILTGPLQFGGDASNFTGPAGPTYTLNDNFANYGTVGAGATGDCNGATGDCYLMSVSGTRPLQHWDATFTETLVLPSIPETIELPVKTWTLHVGESFPDVPTSNQFYAFIENLFHNGVTGGCGGGNYCPGNSVTRAQMAVFLLKGVHGSGYLPPTCSATVFNDEPCPGGPFVDWVNQLASEGITGGCGGGNYCPGNSVTRGQMAVFLLKGQHGGSYAPPACSATVFTDVVCPGAQFVNFINQLAAEGITGGCGGGMYCPGNPNTRGQMAVFLVKTFGLQLYGP